MSKRSLMETRQLEYVGYSNLPIRSSRMLQYEKREVFNDGPK